jgi:general secretion pathway protein A
VYKSFFGFREKPFSLLPDPDYIYMSRGHENAYTHLEYAISENKGFVVITGEIGSGKTTLINFLLNKIQSHIQVGLVNHTACSPNQLLKMICQEFDLVVHDMDKAEILEAFNDFLLEQFASKNRVVLIIDEAQSLSPKCMEEIRMLSNLEVEKHHLLQIIIVGQPELRNRLQQKNLEQFAQRVTVNCHLDHLGQDEIEHYIRHRLRIAGAKNPEIFDKGAVQAIFASSCGIPRLINAICDMALLYGFVDGLTVIDIKVIEDVIKEREAGGIFVPSSGEQTGAARPHPSVGNAVSKPPLGRLQRMEKRIDLLENLVCSMDQRINVLASKKEERDAMVLELFSSLKTTMESRLSILVKFLRSRKKRFADHKDTVTTKAQAQPSLSLMQRRTESKTLTGDQ